MVDAPPNIVTGTTPQVDADDPTLVHSFIGDAWGLFFAQGGVVAAAALAPICDSRVPARCSACRSRAVR